MSRPRRARRRPLLLALLGVLALLVAGCVAPKEQTTPDPSAAPAEGGGDTADGIPEGGLDAFYGQEIAWETCGDFECATVLAPLDWDQPEAGEIRLALKRSVSTGAAESRVGSLIINPGGPGVSSVDFLEYAVTSFSERLLGAYDVVAFDPRGVGQSSAVDCGDDATVDDFLTTDVAFESQADVDAAREEVRAFGEACLEATGPLLGEIDTVSAARDMDLLRDLLGDDQLYYAGFSYGTFLGATYADLYPDKVGRVLLDGALDPSMTNDDLVIGQAEGFEDALAAYVASCQATAECPLTGSVEDGKQQVADLLARVERNPIEVGDGEVLNGTIAWYGVVVTLYDDASWPYLTMALQEAIVDNTGGTLYELGNFYLHRTADGKYLDNSMIAFTAINCLDYPTTVREYDEMVAFAEEVTAVAPTFGREFALAVGCEAWPFQSQAVRGPIAASGAAPILVVGTTGDPATPYEWSVALAEQLESAHLLTWKGEGHTAYGRANRCVTDAVDDYLIEGTMPEEGRTC